MLTCGLLALAGCGGGTKVVTKTVTAPRNSPAPTPTPTPAPAAAGQSAAALAAARAFDSTAVAADATQAGSPLGGAVFAIAAIAAAGSLPTHRTTTASANSPPRAPPARVVSGQASGDFAVAYTNGTFHHPSHIVMNIAASPPQPGSVDWNVVCFENSGGIGRKQGRETLQLPATKTLPLPAPSSSCIASANVQLSKTGTVTISISG
jgi:hypothetical protein